MYKQKSSCTPAARCIVDERVYLYLTENALDDLIDACVQSVNGRGKNEPDMLSPAEVAWCRCVFTLIALGGLAGPRALEEILELRYQDLRSANAGYIHIPRAGGRYRIYVPQTAAPFVLSLLNHLTRGRGPGRNRQGEFPPDGFVLPGRPDPLSPVTLDEQRRYQEMFRAWLRKLGKSIGLNVPVGRLIALARGRVLQDYSPPIAATLLGLHLLNPIPVEQDAVVSQYRSELDWMWVIDPERAIKKTRSRIRVGRPIHDKSETPGAAGNHSDVFRTLRKLVVGFGNADRENIKSARKVVVKGLNGLAKDAESNACKLTNESWAEYLQRHTNTGFNWEQVDAINVCILSRWFMVQTKRHAPNTAIARLADIFRVMRDQPSGMLIYLGEEDLLRTISGLTVASSRRERIADTWRQFFHYLRFNLGIPVPDIAAWRLRDRPIIKENRLLTQPDFEKLLAYVFHTPVVGRAAAAALLIGYYFGLRVSEICRLRLGDLWLDGTPTIFVRPSKRGRSRFIEGVQIPKEVTQFLQDLRNSRLDEVDYVYSAALLVDDRSSHLTRHRLMRIIASALTATSIKGREDCSQSAMHLLRHACANRWWAMGVPLIDITHKMGHRSPDTTIRHYLHIAPFLQAEECQRIKELGFTFTKVGLASLMGITPARLDQLERSMFSPLSKDTKDMSDDGYLLGSVNQSLERFLHKGNAIRVKNGFCDN